MGGNRFGGATAQKLGWVLFGLVAQLAGCQNACQELCGRMADYAAECGLPPVSDAEMDACIQRQQGSALDKGDRGVCRQFNDPSIIRSQWQCEDLSDYFVPAADGAQSSLQGQAPGGSSLGNSAG